MADWFSEDFALGSPLRAPVGATAAHVWWYYDSGHTSQYAKLIQARDSLTPIEVDDDAGIDGTPGLLTTDTSVAPRYATFAIRGTASSRLLTDPGVHALDFDVKFAGPNDESLEVDLYSSVSMSYVDLHFTINAAGGLLYCTIWYQQPNGVDFGVETVFESDTVFGTAGEWRTGGLWHHVRVEITPGTVTTWTPGTFNGDNDYTGGTLEVASDGQVKVYLDEALTATYANLPLILNYEGQSANESSPGAWVADSFGTEAYVGTLSMIDLSIGGGSGAIYDNVTLGPLDAWVPIANYVPAEINSASYPSATARVVCDLWAGTSGVGVQARLYNVTDAVSVGTSATVTSTEATDATFSVALTSGVKSYRVEVTADTEGVDIFCQTGGLVP